MLVWKCFSWQETAVVAAVQAQAELRPPPLPAAAAANTVKFARRLLVLVLMT